jgi:hypothetical protein
MAAINSGQAKADTPTHATYCCTYSRLTARLDSGEIPAPRRANRRLGAGEVHGDRL